MKTLPPFCNMNCTNIAMHTKQTSNHGKGITKHPLPTYPTVLCAKCILDMKQHLATLLTRVTWQMSLCHLLRGKCLKGLSWKTQRPRRSFDDIWEPLAFSRRSRVRLLASVDDTGRADYATQKVPGLPTNLYSASSFSFNICARA